jgi:hypothetical protein
MILLGLSLLFHFQLLIGVKMNHYSKNMMAAGASYFIFRICLEVSLPHKISPEAAFYNLNSSFIINNFR